MTDGDCPDEIGLLELLDHEAPPAVVAHVERCSACRQQLTRLRKGLSAMQNLRSISVSLAPPAAAIERAAAAPLFIDKYFVAGVALQAPGVTVYRAAHSLLKTELLLFVLEQAVEADSPLGELLVQQAKRVTQVEHPALPRVEDFGFHDDRPYLVTEAPPGRDLGRVLAEDRLPARAALQLVAELAAAVAALHEQGIGHGHIDTAWVLLDNIGSPHLLGGGVGLLENSVATTSSSAPQSPTAAAQQDVQALGLLLETLLGGSSSPNRAEVPRALRPLLARALQADASRRPTAAELAAGLAQVAAIRRRLAWLAFIGALVGGAAAWAWTRWQ